MYVAPLGCTENDEKLNKLLSKNIQLIQVSLQTSDSTRRFCFSFLFLTAASLFASAPVKISRAACCFRVISHDNQSACCDDSFPAVTMLNM